MKLKLFYKIFLSFFLVALVPMAVAGYYFINKLADYQQQMIVETSRIRVSLAAQELADKISAIEQSINFTRRLIQQPDNSYKLLENCALQHEEILNEFVTDEKGRVLSSFMRYGFTAKGSRIALPSISPAEEKHVDFVSWNLEPQLAVTYSLTDISTGKRQGLLLTEISLKNLLSSLFINKNQQRNLYIVSSDGRIISHKNINYVLAGRDVSTMPVIHALLQGAKFDNSNYLDLEDSEVVGVGMRINDLPLYVVEETPVSVAYALSRTMKENIINVCLLIALVTLAASLLLAGSITRPIVQLKKATAKIGSGELDTRVKFSHWLHDEVDIFALRFNEMIDALQKDREQRREAESNLADERERLMVTLRSIADGVISIDLDGRITMMNSAAEEITGWPLAEAGNLPVFQVLQLVNPESGDQYDAPPAEIFNQGHLVRLDQDVALVTRDGRQLLVAYSGSPMRDSKGHVVGAVLVFQDITARKRMEIEIQQSERIRSVGLLAGGIAHDFNNQLTGIMGNIGLAKMFLEPESKSYSYLDEAENAAMRSRDLTLQLLTFARGGSPVKKVSSIVGLITETSKFVLRGSAVDCRLKLDPELWPIDFDEGQICQVMNNLLINAIQAMPDGGIITIMAQNHQLDHGDGVPLPPGRYVMITIRDQGIGMTTNQLQKIFEPYFTTKKEGRGLGLASCYSIISNHDGHISAESRPDQGTVFTIYLPASDKEIPELAETTEKKKFDSGGGRILVMDDEEMIRAVSGGFLEHLGFQPSFAADGNEAIELYKQAVNDNKPFVAVIMDLTIPGGMGGKNCVREILKINPEAKVIVASGYSNDPVMADFRQYGFSGVMVKPFSLDDFSEALQKILGEQS